MDGTGLTTIDNIHESLRWSDKSRASLGTIIGRYINNIENHKLKLLRYTHKTTGPYLLQVPISDIQIDISYDELREFIRIPKTNIESNSFSLDDLHTFVETISTGDKFLYKGILGQEDNNKKQSAQSMYINGALKVKNQQLKWVLYLRQYIALHRAGKNKRATTVLTNIVSASDVDSITKSRALNYLARQCYFQKNTKAMRRYLDEATQLLPYAQDDISAASTLSLKAYDFRSRALRGLSENRSTASIQNDIEKCLMFFSKALFLTTRSWYYDAIQQICYNIANSLFKIGNEYEVDHRIIVGKDRDQIMSWVELCDQICEQHNVGSDTFLNDLLRASVVYNRDRDPGKAFGIVKAAQVKIKNIGNKYDLGISYRQLAIFHKQKNPKDPLINEYRTLSIQLLIEAGAIEAAQHVKNDIPI